MDKLVKKLAKETALCGLGNIIVRACSYVIFLLQTDILTPAEYGIITEFYGSYIALGHIIYDLTLDIAYFRFAQKLGKQHTFNTITTILWTTTIIFSTTIILSIPQIAKLTNNLSHIRYFYYITGILALDTLLTMPYAKLRITQHIFSFSLVKFLQACAGIFFSLTLLYVPACLSAIEYAIASCFHITVDLNNLDAVFIANLLSSTVALALLLPTFKGFRLTYRCNTIRIIMRYAASSFCTTLFCRLNQLLPIALFRKLVPNGFYVTHTKETILGNLGSACKLTLILTIWLQAFQYMAEPFFFTYADRKDARKLYSQTMQLFIFSSCMGLLLFSLNINWIARILIPQASYRHTVDILPYIGFSHILLGIYYNFSFSFKLSNNPQYNTWINAFGCCVTGGMALLLIPRLGHWGCIYASMSSAIFMVVLGYYFGQKYYSIPYYKKGFLLLLLTLSVLEHVALWPAKFTYLTIGWAYILLNIAIIATFYIIGMRWKKYTHL